eukprot:722668-Karenia_brevis.AAC.1
MHICCDPPSGLASPGSASSNGASSSAAGSADVAASAAAFNAGVLEHVGLDEDQVLPVPHLRVSEVLGYIDEQPVM